MSDVTATLGNIVAQAVGPLPQVCQEQVLLDMERARMSAEDLRIRMNTVVEIIRFVNFGALTQEDAIGALRVELSQYMSVEESDEDDEDMEVD